MQAIASSASDRMPMMCEGSSFSDSSGGIRKPVALVRIVNSRKIAVSPGCDREPSMPNITISPATIPIRLMTTCTRTNVSKPIPKIMTRPSTGNIPEDTTQPEKTPHASRAVPARQACARIKTHQRKLYDARNLCRDVTNDGTAALARISAIEKFDQLGDHLIGRL